MHPRSPILLLRRLLPSSLATAHHFRNMTTAAPSTASGPTLSYKLCNEFTRRTRPLATAAATQTALAPASRTMRAVVPDGHGGTSLVTLPIPVPGDDEVLLKVAAIGVNRADVLQIAGKYSPPPGAPATLGLEASGYLPNGKRAAALLTGGAYAEYAVVPRSAILPLPARVADFYSLAQLAALPEAFVAAYHTLFDLGMLRENQAVLINAAASGVGVAAIQLAASVPGVIVIASAGSDAKLDVCKQLGAMHVINYRTQSTAQEVARVTQGEGVDLAVDCVGAAQFNDIERSLRRGGRWVVFGLLGGAKGNGVGLAGVVMKHLTLCGTTLRARSQQERARIITDFARRFGECFGPNGSLKPVVHAEMEGLESAPDALRVMRNNENIGKLVLTL